MQDPAKTPPLSTQAGLLAAATLLSLVLFRGGTIPTPIVVVTCIVVAFGWVALFMAWFLKPSKRT